MYSYRVHCTPIFRCSACLTVPYTGNHDECGNVRRKKGRDMQPWYVDRIRVREDVMWAGKGDEWFQIFDFAEFVIFFCEWEARRRTFCCSYMDNNLCMMNVSILKEYFQDTRMYVILRERKLLPFFYSDYIKYLLSRLLF